VKLLNMPFMPLGVLLRPLGLKCVPPPYVCTPWGSLKPLGAHIYSLESQLCPLGLFYAPWGSSMHLPFKRACPPQAYAPPVFPCMPPFSSVRASLSSMCAPLPNRTRPYIIHVHPLGSRIHSYGSRSHPPQSRALYSPCNIMEVYIQPSNVATTWQLP
jgi:hypothetical protein